MSIHENKLPVGACKILLRLRRTRSEEIERTSTCGNFRGSTTALDRSPARAQSLNLFLLLTNLEQPAISLRISDTNKLEDDNCGCSTTRLPRLADPVRTRSSGSLSAASFNLLDDQVFTGRERGSRTSIANVKSREDLVMSDHGGASNSQLQPSNGNLTLGLKVANGGPKQTDKRATKKRRPEKDKDKEKTQKDAVSTGAKASMQLDSPSAAKPKYKHGATSSQETANWPVWNTVRSSRTRLNESCSEQEEQDGGEQPNVVDDASWQFMSMLSFRHGQRDDSKYRQLSAGESSASEADTDTPAPAALPANRSTQSATRTDQTQVQTTLNAPSDSVERVQPAPTATTLRTSVSPSQRPDSICEQNWARWEFIEKTRRIGPSETAQSLNVEPRVECDAERPTPEVNDPQQTAAAERPRQPDASSRPLLFDQDDSDTSNDCEPDPAADCADLATALDELDCAADCLLHEHSQNGVAEEDVISAAKVQYYATLSGTLDTNANSNASNVRKQVLYGLDPRETSDDDQHRVAAPPPPPPPRRTLPANSATQPQRENSGNVRPSQLENITTGRSTPSDCVSTPSIGVALLPPPPSVPRRSSAGSKPSVAAARGTTKRQHWLARFDDDDDETSTQMSQPSPGPPPNALPPTTFISTAPHKPVTGAVRFVTTQPHDVPYDPNEEEENDDTATCSDEQTRIMVAAGARRRSSTTVNAINPLSDGTASLGRAAKKQQKRPTSGSTSSSRPESQIGNADMQRSSVVDAPFISQLPAPHPTVPSRSETATAFANLSFVDCASDCDSRSPNGLAVAPAEQRKTDVDSATVRSSSAGSLNCPPPTDKPMDDPATRAAARPACKEQSTSVRPDKADKDKEAPNSRRTHLLTFLRKPHLSNDSSSDSSDDSRNAIAKGDDTPDSPTAFQHRRFSSASPSCSSQDSDYKSHADAGAPNAKRPHAGAQQPSGLLASLTSFTFPRGLRRAVAKKSASASAAQASAVTSDVCG